jgi:hypothetical protein
MPTKERRGSSTSWTTQPWRTRSTSATTFRSRPTTVVVVVNDAAAAVVVRSMLKYTILAKA